jgi:aspartate kinase
MVVWDKPIVRKMLEEMENIVYRLTIKEVAIVCAMGSNIAHPGFLYRGAYSLSKNNINIECFGQSLKQVNMQFVINRDRYVDAVIALNDALCVN